MQGPPTEFPVLCRGGLGPKLYAEGRLDPAQCPKSPNRAHDNFGDVSWCPARWPQGELYGGSQVTVLFYDIVFCFGDHTQWRLLAVSQDHLGCRGWNRQLPSKPPRPSPALAPAPFARIVQTSPNLWERDSWTPRKRRQLGKDEQPEN